VLNPAPMNINPQSATNSRDLILSEFDRASDGFPIIGLLDNKNWTIRSPCHRRNLWNASIHRQ
jgi:hypothetical protein